MNKKTTKVCVWKSSDRWKEGIAGATDVDLLVGSDYFDTAVKKLKDNGWFQVTAEPWRRFDGVVDFVSYQSGFTQHLHLHNRIVSGEKLVKSFSPDFTALYLASAQKQGYPYFVKPELEFVTFILRMSLKLGWRDFARILKRRSKQAFLRPFIEEYTGLRRRIDPVDLKVVLQQKELSQLPIEIIEKASEDLSKLGLSDIWRLRKAISRWRRIKGVKLLLQTICRSILKRFLGVGKPLALRGISIAVCGPDGSGKTTLVSALNTELAKQIKVRSFYLGGSSRRSGFLRSSVRTITMPMYLATRKFFRILGNKKCAEFVESIYTNLDDRMMDRDKRTRLRAGSNYAKIGGLTIYERFPLFSPYGDGFVGNYEIDTEYQPDLVILISVGMEIARKRRPTDLRKRLEAKIEAFDQFGSVEGPCKHKLLHLNGAKPMLENVKCVLQQLNDLICQKAENPKA
jgi:hypothetical protein